MVELYGLFLPDGEWERRELSPFRRERAERLKNPEARARSLAAGACLDYALRRHGLREGEMTYRLGPHGKPEPEGVPGLHFNLSHSGNWAVCALSDAPVGVDVQMGRTGAERAAKRLWGDAVRDRETALLLWTAGEAAVKCLGLGLADLGRVRVDLSRSRAQWGDTVLFFRHYPLEGGALALCCPRKEFPGGMERVPGR